MNRVLALCESRLVRVGRFDHPPNEPHSDPAEEWSDHYCISFVEQGRFLMARGRHKEELGPGSLILTQPGLAFRCSHDQARPDDVCLSISFLDNAAVEDTLLGLGQRVGRKQLHFARPPTNRLAYLKLRLARLLASILVRCEPADGLPLDELSAEMLEAAYAPLGTRPEHTYDQRQLKWYAERVEAARELLERRSEQPHSLTSLAGCVHMSPFHFARVFRALVGKPPHRYLLEVRLARAARLLREGLSVTETCFAAGFNNLSYFTRRFRRCYGTAPSQFAN
jgi:AraC-like DNA-binding protein